jgi:predicted phage tail protein
VLIRGLLPQEQDMTKKAENLEALKKKQAQLKARIAAIEAKQKANQRKEDTRLKIIIGAALMADAALHPDTAAFLAAVLRRAVTAERDREFLKRKGWFSESEP